MSHIRMPYQSMVTCGNALVAARGSSIDSFNLENGSLLSTWTCPAPQDVIPNQKPSAIKSQTHAATSIPAIVTEEVGGEDDGPPAKKRKLSSENIKAKNEEISASSPNSKQEQHDGKKKKQKQNNRSEAVVSGLQAPAVIALAATKDGKHVIAVTGEDKSIRVFENIEERGSHRLKQLSQRAMPKRPCSITITADDQTITSADKFGDVYSLPLIPEETNQTSQTPEPMTAPKVFVPAANELTIHSQRNRKALENQKRQTNRPIEKSEPTFEHKLLLGHVSMLTDVALVTVQGRNYILTADRDEHIRISRGIPQAHIIEGFCLGHTEFITRLCLPDFRPEVLISGGGEDKLFVWDWMAGKLEHKIDLRMAVDAVRRELDVFKKTETPQPELNDMKFVVSGLLGLQETQASGNNGIIVVTCEGVPALFTYVLTPSKALTYTQTIILKGNALAMSATSSGLIVSIDTIHKPGSSSELRTEQAETPNPLQTFELKPHEIMLVESILDFEDVEAKSGEVEAGAVGRLGNLLYGLENLRKREGDGGEE